jgi:hypothetical protein
MGRKADTSKQEKLAQDQMRIQQQQHADTMKMMAAQMEAMPDIPTPEAPPPPVSGTSADTEQARRMAQEEQRKKKGITSTIAAGETGGAKANLGNMTQSLLGNAKA